MKSFIRTCIATFALAFASVAGSASATPFSITGASFTAGSGYGIDGTEMSSTLTTLLDVRFSTAGFATQNFNLSTVGQQYVFNMGTINFAESNDGGGIRQNERDNLGLSASFVFALPGAGPQSVTATANAIAASIQDSADDFFLDWSDIDVAFGNSGLYRISLTDMAFGFNTRLQSQAVTIELVRADTAVVPEPSSLALGALGLLGLGVAVRRRR